MKQRNHNVAGTWRMIGYILILALHGLFAQDRIIAGKSPDNRTAADEISVSSGCVDGMYTSGMDPRQSCTIIYASDGKKTLAGNNEDYSSPFGTIWFFPAEDGKFGRVYFGWKSHGRMFPQGGMNDQGLFFDGATAERVIVPRDTTKPLLGENLIEKAMNECSSVEDVLNLIDRYDMPGSYNGHFLFGDRFGQSAIIEPRTVIRKSGRYQIATNFLQSKVKPENIADTRYRTAAAIFDQSEEITVDLFRRILSAVHWEDYSGSMSATQYSYVLDLQKGDIYIYHFHDFEDVVKINLHEELRNGERAQSIVSLFPFETFASKQYKAQRTLGLLYESVLENGVEGDEGAAALFKEIQRGDYQSYRLSAGEGHLNALGYELLNNNKVKEAIEVFAYAVSEYPESANAYDSLGEAYMKTGDNVLAVKNYKKSLELDPTNENARKMIEQLQH